MRAVFATLAAALVLAALAPPARAGTYDVWSCMLPDVRPAPTTGWRPTGEPYAVDWCRESRGLRAEFPNVTVGSTATTGWWFEAPPGIVLENYELYRAARIGIGPDSTSRAYALYHDAPEFVAETYLKEYCIAILVSTCVEKGDYAATEIIDADNQVARTGLRIRRIILRMECRAYPVPRDCPPADMGGGFRIERARLGVLDDVYPSIGVPSSAPFRDGEIIDGPQALTLHATDTGGGIEKLVVAVDGVVVAEKSAADVSPTCRRPFVDFVPCPLELASAIAFNTASVDDGLHRLQVGAVDAAGNQTLSSPASVYFVNGGSPNGIGATRDARVRAALGRAKRTDKTIGFIRRERLHGRLTDSASSPIKGAIVEIRSTARLRGERQALEGRTTTDAGGRFVVRLRRGPSRRIEVRYFATTKDPIPSARATVTLRVRAGVRLSVRPRRTTSHGMIRFRGRLLGGPGKAATQVGLYAVDRTGRRRVPVELLSADSRGHFRFRYRFLRTFAPFTYRFQARVAAQPGYPYAAGASRIVTVRIVR